MMARPRTALWRDRTARRVRKLADAIAMPPPADRLRRQVGGNWDVIGPMQLEYLQREGLEPGHALLDVGCGTLRGGIHFVRYLDDGNYYGIDINPEMLEGGRQELALGGLADRRCTLRATDTFDADFGRPFDFALALSVFTHVPLNSVVLCLTNLSEQLAPGGRFYATFFRGPDGPDRRAPIRQPALEGFSSAKTYCDRNNYHYAFSDFLFAAQGLPLRVDDVGDWGHPRGQQMLRFTRS
jgi:SAM-dependent methyltransferase